MCMLSKLMPKYKATIALPISPNWMNIPSDWSWQSVFETGCVFHKISNYSSLRGSNSCLSAFCNLLQSAMSKTVHIQVSQILKINNDSLRMTRTSKNITGNVEIPFPAPHFPVGTALPSLSIISCSALVTWLSYTITSHRLLRVLKEQRRVREGIWEHGH